MSRVDRLHALPRYATICGVAWLGSMFLWMTPSLFLAIKQGFAWNTIDTAYVISALLMSGGAGLLVVNFFVRRLATGTVAIIGAALELAGLLAIIFSHEFRSAMVGALAAGLGSGFVMSCAPRIAARLPVPARGYAAAGGAVGGGGGGGGGVGFSCCGAGGGGGPACRSRNGATPRQGSPTPSWPPPRLRSFQRCRRPSALARCSGCTSG